MRASVAPPCAPSGGGALLPGVPLVRSNTQEACASAMLALSAAAAPLEAAAPGVAPASAEPMEVAYPGAAAVPGA